MWAARRDQHRKGASHRELADRFGLAHLFFPGATVTASPTNANGPPSRAARLCQASKLGLLSRRGQFGRRRQIGRSHRISRGHRIGRGHRSVSSWRFSSRFSRSFSSLRAASRNTESGRSGQKGGKAQFRLGHGRYLSSRRETHACSTNMKNEIFTQGATVSASGARAEVTRPVRPPAAPLPRVVQTWVACPRARRRGRSRSTLGPHSHAGGRPSRP